MGREREHLAPAHGGLLMMARLQDVTASIGQRGGGEELAQSAMPTRRQPVRSRGEA